MRPDTSYEAIAILAIAGYGGEISGTLKDLSQLMAFLEVGCLRDQKGALNWRRNCLQHSCVRFHRQGGQPDNLGAAEQRSCFQFGCNPVWNSGGVGIVKPDQFRVRAGFLREHSGKSFGSC